MSETMYDRIAARLKTLNKSERGAALEAGLSEAAIRNIKRGASESPRGKTVTALARVLGTTEEYLIHGTNRPDDDASPEPAMRSAIIPGANLVSSQRMPVYAAAMGGDGHLIISFDEIDQIKRPAELESVKGGYGLLIKGSSMVPALWEGDMALVNPHLPPAREFNHIFYHEPPGGGTVEAMVKQLDAYNDRDWTVRQWNPDKTWKESRQIWQVCHRVVGKYDRR